MGSKVEHDGLRLRRRATAGHYEKIAVLRREVRFGVDQTRSDRLSKRSVAEIAAELDASEEPSP
jgi:hypothetical protein